MIEEAPFLYLSQMGGFGADHLLDSNRRFHAYLEARGIPHSYREHPGGHNWDYWDAHVSEALKQHMGGYQLV